MMALQPVEDAYVDARQSAASPGTWIFGSNFSADYPDLNVSMNFDLSRTYNNPAENCAISNGSIGLVVSFIPHSPKISIEKCLQREW